MDDSGLGCAERWEIDDCTGLEWKANIWSVAPPSLARGAAARGKRLREVEERYEGKKGKI